MALKKCPPGLIRNPLTGKCVDKNAPLNSKGKKTKSRSSSSGGEKTKSRSSGNGGQKTKSTKSTKTKKKRTRKEQPSNAEIMRMLKLVMMQFDGCRGKIPGYFPDSRHIGSIGSSGSDQKVVRGEHPQMWDMWVKGRFKDVSDTSSSTWDPKNSVFTPPSLNADNLPPLHPVLRTFDFRTRRASVPRFVV